MNKPTTMCLAPWVHTYLSPQTERRMCCASREPAQNFTQYIDTKSGTGRYIPITLDEHWNGEHMRSVRTRMMAGETLPECEVCNDRLLNTDVYRTYFDRLFEHKIDEIYANTDPVGYTTMRPVSWDYRFSNLCNFKCRTCGDMLSSSWESEQRQHNQIDWNDPRNNWMQPAVRGQIHQFQTSQIEYEFSRAVESHSIEEVYWVGGEPLMYEQHWRYMRRIVELGDGPTVYARYNTNLSRIQYKKIDLFSDILDNLRDWQVCASLDGTGATGEYIRTGLVYADFLDNFKRGLEHVRHPRQLRLDFTLTLPGMMEVERIQALADSLGVDVLAKVIFSFTPDIILSPLALPRTLLNGWVDRVEKNLRGALRDVVLNLKQRENFEEKWPGLYHKELAKGRARVLQLEQQRPGAATCMDRILSEDPAIHQWWRSLA